MLMLNELIVNLRSNKIFLYIALLMFQLLLMFYFPLFGDEAYFVNWGNQFNLGIYDHPPLTGMFSWVFNNLESSGYWLRFISWLMSIYLTFILYMFGKKWIDHDSAILVALVFLLPPINLMLLPLYTNDILMSFLLVHFVLGGYFSLILVEREGSVSIKSLFLSLIAGICLGLALLTKYFAGIYALSFAIYVLLNYKKHYRYIFTCLPIIVIVSTIIFLTHIWWNYNNCAVNYAFHFLSRARHEPMSGFGKTALTLLLTVSPFLLVNVIKNKFYADKWNKNANFFTFMFCFSLLIFILVGVVGGHFSLHWTAINLAFFGSLMLVELADKQLIEKAYRFVARLTLSFFLISILAVSIVVSNLNLFPESSISKQLERLPLISNFYSDIESGVLKEQLHSEFPGYDVVSSQYYIAETFTYHGIPAVALFSRSKYGRQNDIAIDYSLYDGHDIIIFRMPWRSYDPKYNKYFDKAEWITIDTPTGGSYPAIKGENFNFEKYREQFLRDIIDRHYSYELPYSSCYMDKYR